MQKHLGTWWDHVGQIWTLGDARGGRVITIFVSHVGPHIPNIEYFEVYGGIWRLYENIWGYMTVHTGK